MNLAQLKALCEAQGQPNTGNKSVRIKQLLNPTEVLGKKAKKAEAKAAQSHPVMPRSQMIVASYDFFISGKIVRF